MLIEFLADISYGNLPASVISDTKRLILDAIGVALGGSETATAKIIVDHVRELGGNPESTLMRFGGKTCSPNASLANAVMGNVLDLDDTHRDSITHVGAVVIPAALAVAEREEASGKDLISSIVAGYECTCRVSTAVFPSGWLRGFHPMSLSGTLGAAMAAAKILGLNSDQMMTALSFAATQACGLMASLWQGGDTRRLNPGRAAYNGVAAALLAQKGFTGSPAILEGERGFCKAFTDEHHIEKITEELGRRYEISRTSIKPHACCRHYHSALDATLQIRQEAGIDVDEIESINVVAYENAVTRPHNPVPLSVFDAQRSMPYCLALAILYGGVRPEHFSEERIRDPKILALAKKVSISSDAELTKLFPQQWPSIVRIGTRSGKQYVSRVDLPKGEPENPLTREELLAKFSGLVVPVLGDKAAEEIARLVLDELDRLHSTAELAESFHS